MLAAALMQIQEWVLRSNSVSGFRPEGNTMESFRGLSRRRFLAGFSAASAAIILDGWGCAKREAAGPCPAVTGRTIRWIVPYSVGGGYDTVSRLIEPFYGKKLEAEIVIENVPGAGGVVGANQIKGGAPDGLMLGIINAPGLLVAAMTEQTKAPNPALDFTILGRVTRNQIAWVTGPHSRFRTFDDVLAAAQKRTTLFAATEVASINFVNAAVLSAILGFGADFVTGFPGSREETLAAVRGEVDLVSVTFDSVVDRIDAGDLRPLLQISSKPISTHSSLAGVPMVAGEQGLAARRLRRCGSK